MPRLRRASHRLHSGRPRPRPQPKIPNQRPGLRPRRQARQHRLHRHSTIPLARFQERLPQRRSRRGSRSKARTPGQPTFGGGPLATNFAGDTQPLVGGPAADFHGGLGGINMNQYSGVANLSPLGAALGPILGGPPSPPSAPLGGSIGTDVLGGGIGADTFGGFSGFGGFTGGGYTDVGGPGTGLDEGSNMDTDADLSDPGGGLGGFDGGFSGPDPFGGGGYADTGGSVPGADFGGGGYTDPGNYGGPDRDTDDHGW
jgi:hypothetical protein